MADDSDGCWYQPNSPKAPPRQSAPGELLFQFHVERTHTFWRVELRDHGIYGVEAQFLDPIDDEMLTTIQLGNAVDIIRHCR